MATAKKYVQKVVQATMVFQGAETTDLPLHVDQLQDGLQMVVASTYDPDQELRLIFVISEKKYKELSKEDVDEMVGSMIGQMEQLTASLLSGLVFKQLRDRLNPKPNLN